MAKKLDTAQVAREINGLVQAFSGKSIKEWVQTAWDLSQGTTIGQAAAGVGRAAKAMDPYAVLGLPRSATLEEVKNRYRQLATIYHPDKGGTNEGFCLIRNAYGQITKEREGK